MCSKTAPLADRGLKKEPQMTAVGNLTRLLGGISRANHRPSLQAEANK